MKLVRVEDSPIDGKKWRAVFRDGDKMTHTDFGASGYEDYTQHHDKERRRLYKERHSKDLDTRDPTRAGFLSYYILWGDSTDIRRNISSYKKRFSL
jgi:hypothetical protein